MNLSENQELFVIFPAMIISIILLIVIDRIGAIRPPSDEDEEEI
jgi:hypothetical protein